MAGARKSQDPGAAMGVQNDDYKTLEITLTGTNNKTLRGVLNFTAGEMNDYKDEEEIYDSKGAATFVVVVILVYGLSIVLMIGSLAKKNMKVKDADLEEKQIHRYLCQANDLKEKGAKENYRQLKRNIISLVNKGPQDVSQVGGPSFSEDPAHNVGHDMIRSMLAVGSPSAAQVSLPKSNPSSPTAESDSTPSKKVNRLISETDSLQALLEEDEEGEDGPDEPFATPPPVIRGPPRVEVRPAPGHRRQSLNSETDSRPGTSLTSPITIVPVHSKVVDGIRRSKSAVEGLPQSDQTVVDRTIPTVVISGPESGAKNNRLRALDIQSANSGNRLNSMEKESKIICNVDGSQPNQSCKLSMDSAGNIWILQDSPVVDVRTQQKPPSPSVSTPGSIGYESLGTSRTPSPSFTATRSPSPAMPIASSSRSRRDRAHSVGTGSNRDRSRSPRDLSDRSHSPTPQSYGSCCEHKHGIIPTSAANLLPSGRKSPYHDHRDQVLYRNDVTGLRKDVMVPILSSTPHSRHNIANMAIPHTSPDTDEEELVQITTV